MLENISKNEWIFLVIVWIIVSSVIFFPIIFAYMRTPPDHTFIFTPAMNFYDYLVYYSQIEQVKAGHFLVKDLFTSEAQPVGIFYSFWFLVGITAKIFSVSTFLIFQLTRFLLIPVFLVSSYYFIAYFFKEKIKRKICFIFLIFASGWYFLLRAEDINKFNAFGLSVPEAFTFTTLDSSPHFVAALTLLGLIFLFSCMAFEKYRLKYSVIAGFLALLLFSFHPYHMYSIFGVLGAVLLVDTLKNKKINIGYLKHIFIVGIISLPAILYQLWTIINIPVVYEHFLQNITTTPPLSVVIAGYGLLLPLALFGAFSILKKKDKSNKEVFLVVWFFTHLSLLYLPVKTQVRLTMGLQFAMSVLVMYGLVYLIHLPMVRNLRQRYGMYYAKDPLSRMGIILVGCFLFIFLFLPTNIMFLAFDTQFYSKSDSVCYLSKDIQDAMVWLKSTPEDSIILSSEFNGNIMPMFSLRQVFIGHHHETAQFKKKYDGYETFFMNGNDQERIALLKEYHINYVFFGPEEKKVAIFNPDSKSFLEKVFQNSKVTIYKVTI